MDDRLLELLRMALSQHATDIHFVVRGGSVTLQLRCGQKIRQLDSDARDMALFR